MTKWITKCVRDYKVCQGGLQSVTGITKCDGIIKCGGIKACIQPLQIQKLCIIYQTFSMKARNQTICDVH